MQEVKAVSLLAPLPDSSAAVTSNLLGLDLLTEPVAPGASTSFLVLGGVGEPSDG